MSEVCALAWIKVLTGSNPNFPTSDIRQVTSTTYTEPRTAVEFVAACAELLRDRPEDAPEVLERLTRVNDGWMQPIEERAANADLLDAIAVALEELGAF